MKILFKKLAAPILIVTFTMPSYAYQFKLGGKTYRTSPEKIETAVEETYLRAHIIITSMKGFWKDHGRYPTTQEGISILVDKYIKLYPTDPWGNKYNYDNSNGIIDVYSLGKDNLAGGINDARDIHLQLFSRIEPLYSF